MEWTAPLTFSPYALYLKPHNVSAAPLLRLLLNWPENMCDIPGLIIEHLDITSDLQLVLIWCYWSRLIGLLLVLMQFIVSFTISSSVEVVMIKCIFSHFILKQPSGYCLHRSLNHMMSYSMDAQSLFMNRDQLYFEKGYLDKLINLVFKQVKSHFYRVHCTNKTE